jgi:hypothetical protein
MYGELFEVPILIKKVTNTDIYYKLHHGSSLIFTLFDQNKNLIARGTGMSWNENPQLAPYMEWGKKYCIEIVKGAMNPGQLTVQGANFLHLNDSMPTVANLIENRELTAFVQVGPDEAIATRGLVIDVFKGVFVGAQSGNWNSQTLYMRNAQMMFRKRMTGAEWLNDNPGLGAANSDHAAYPANVGLPTA